MPKPDLILLHAPSVYDFRRQPILFGPVSDVVPSTQVFEMYPLGFMTILAHLQKHGYSVRIINVALRMLQSRRFDAEKLIRRLAPAVFGIDLHWMVHAQGSLELAAIVKKHHPQTPVLFGGLSASYFHEELIRCDQVDFVIRGDSTEEPVRMLLSALETGSGLEHVPNLTWVDRGRVRVNDLSHVPGDLENVSFDYRSIMKSCRRHLDILGHLPFKSWLKYPIVAALSCRGCIHDCSICGGSASAYRRICGRRAPSYRPPADLARDIGLVSRFIRAPVMLLGDILQAGPDYARSFFEAVGKEGVRNEVAFEFFRPPPRDILQMAASALPNFNLQVSPESHDESLRRTFGRHYDNASLEQSIEDALDAGCKRVDVFFMIGIPRQTVASVRATVEYCGELLARATRGGHAGRVHPFISPLAPFLDPGSKAFEDPEAHGYRLFHRTLEEHRQALLAPSWKYTLNYETTSMSRDELVDVTYEAALELNRMKSEHGLITPRSAQRIADRIGRERDLVGRIDAILSLPSSEDRDEQLRELTARFDTVGPATICDKDEMNWPAALLRFNPFRVIWDTFFG